MIRYLLLVIPCLIVDPARAQVSDVPPPMRPVMNDPVQGGWRATELEQQATLWEQLATTSKAEAASLSQLNHFRSERNASLARNKGRIPDDDRKNLVEITLDLERNAPNSFESYLANYYLEHPAPSAYMHLDLAMARDRERAELLGPLLGNAARKGNVAELRPAARAFRERGGVAEGLWHLADDILLSLDPDAVLIAAGEMDAYPVWGRQYADGRRQDVLVVDQRLLVDPVYRQRIWEKVKARGEVPDQPAAFINRLPGSTDRPVCFSLAVGPEMVRDIKEQLYLTGMVMRFSTTTIDNIPLLEQHWKVMRKDPKAGPLARNYLMPASVLLLHYRRIGDESNAALMEFELRSLARTLGASDKLYLTGVLEH